MLKSVQVYAYSLPRNDTAVVVSAWTSASKIGDFLLVKPPFLVNPSGVGDAAPWQSDLSGVSFAGAPSQVNTSGGVDWQLEWA